MSAKAKSEPKKNGYEDEDFQAVLAEIEDLDDEIETINATARGKVGAIKTRQKNRIKIAKAELGIPTKVIEAVISQRKLERKLEKISAGVPDDEIELYADAAGQFSWLKPSDAKPGETGAQVAARKRMAEIQEVTDSEQAEGAALLDDMAESVH